jgi:hypothetical protein
MMLAPFQSTFRTMNKLIGLLASFTAGILAAAPAFGHHSFAMFDLTRRVTITGVVAEIQWTNPTTIGTKPGQRLGIAGITNSDRLTITERIYLDPNRHAVDDKGQTVVRQRIEAAANP